MFGAVPIRVVIPPKSEPKARGIKSFDGEIENLAVLHADGSDVDLFVELLRPHYPGDIVVGEIGPVIGTHGGRGTIGVAFQVSAT